MLLLRPFRLSVIVSMLVVSMVLCACLVRAEAADPSTFDWKPMDARAAALPGTAYASVGNMVFGIGGISADGSPVAAVEILEPGADGAVKTHQASLSRPLAHASAVGHGGKIYVLGGLESGGPSARVFALEWKDGALVEQELPALPSPRLLAGAAIHRSTTRYYLCAIGGTPSLEKPEALAQVLELLVEGNGAAGEGGWIAQPDLPQGGRIAPMCAETFNEVIVAGGYKVGEGGHLEPTTEVSAHSRIPRDGHEEAGWKWRAALPEPFAQAAISKSGQSHLLFLGGDTSAGPVGQIFGAGGERLLDGIRSYHSLTDTWVALGRMPSASAGGTLATVADSELFLAGARSPDGQALPAAEIEFKSSTRHLHFWDYAVIAIYFVVTLGQGLYFALKKKTVETYAVGGGTMKWWATAMSMAATGVSSISMMAIPALVASMGPVAVAGGALMIIPLTLVSAYITYPMMRRLRVVSVFEYLEQRFGPTLRLFGSFKAIVGTLLGRIGIVILLPSLAISSMTGLDPVISILAIGLVTTIYSAAGGFEAVVWTDVLQGLLLFGGFILLGILAFQGVPDGFKGMAEATAALERDNYFIFSGDPILPSVWFIILGGVLTMLSFPADQSLSQRVMATPLRDVRRFAFGFGWLSILVSLLSLFIGICLLAYFRANPTELSPVMKNDQLVPLFMVQNLPVGLAGFIMAAIFAASMSTVSSGVNSCAVQMAEDFYRRIFKNSTPTQEVWVMRIGTVFTGLLGTASALWLLRMPMPTLWETFTRIIALLGGGFGGVFILGFITRRAHSLGAIIGVLASAVVAYLLQFGSFDVHWTSLGSLITLSCVVVGYVTSILIPWKQKDLTGLTVWNLVKAKVTDEELLAKAGNTEKEAK